jgi:hypothetical protein
MTVQTVKLAGKRFVIVPEADFRKLQRRASDTTVRKPARKPQKAEPRDQIDLEIARRRLSDPSEKPIPYEQVRKELGLA